MQLPVILLQSTHVHPCQKDRKLNRRQGRLSQSAHRAHAAVWLDPDVADAPAVYGETLLPAPNFCPNYCPNQQGHHQAAVYLLPAAVEDRRQEPTKEAQGLQRVMTSLI